MVLFTAICCNCAAQCTIEKGAAPPAYLFKTGGEGAGKPDYVWQVSDALNGIYQPAVVMDSMPSVFYSSSDWISMTGAGEHSGDKIFYFKTNVELPCKTECDVSYDEPNTFCLNFNIYVDNSIYEIYVNGIPQSDKIPGLRHADPYRPDTLTPAVPVPVTICNNWHSGSNELIIAVATSAPILGLLVMERRITPAEKNDTVHAMICRGETYEGHSDAGIYTDVFRSVRGCDSIRVLDLTIADEPQPDLGNKFALCDEDTITLDPGNFLSYKWQDGSTERQFVVQSPGTYRVEVNNGCFVVQKEIVIGDGLCSVYFPNAFSPNGDGKNETFNVRSDLVLSGYHLELYNRWGQKVFETSSSDRGWDGRSGGKAQPAGTYVWQCVFSRNGNMVRRNGTVLLYK